MNADNDDCNNLKHMWTTLIENCGVSEETLRIITNINGYNSRTLHDVLYAVAGERLFDFEDSDHANESSV